MTTIDLIAAPDAPGVRLFQQERQIDRKIMENIYMVHREVYALLHANEHHRVYCLQA